MHAFEEEPEVLRVDSGRDTMSQVRDPPSCLLVALETPAHPPDLPLYRFSPTVQYVRIHVTLERNIWTDDVPSDGRFYAPVQPDHVVTAGLSDILQGPVRPLGKENEGNNGELLDLQLLPNFCGDISEVG